MQLVHNRRELIAGIGALVGVLALNALVAHHQAGRLREDSSRVAHTHEVLAALEHVVSSLTTAETNYRGYVITADSAYLDRYHKAWDAHIASIEQVERLTTDNPKQQAALPEIKSVAAARHEQMERGITLRDTQSFEVVRDFVGTNQGVETSGRLQSLVGQMQARERELLSVRARENRSAYRSLVLSNLAAALLALVGVAAFLWLLNRYLRAISRATALIHEQRQLLEAMLISIGDGVIATDAAGHVVLLNAVAQQLTGWKQPDAIGRPLSEVFQIVNEETRRPVENPALRALREGRILGLANHTVLISRDGSEWPIDDSAAPIRDAQGRMNGAILVFREIRERKRQQAELQRHVNALNEADRRKDEFLATLAHELRNPLSPLSNALQIWPLVENDRHEMEQLRQMMERQVQQMTRLIDDLLDVSRITRGKIELRTQSVDVNTLISGAIEAVQPFVTACGHQLTVTLADAPAIVEGDVARLIQVFGNILHNAAKYSGPKGRIGIAVRRVDEEVVVTIEDNGPGIPPHMLRQIFEMFQQVDQTLERSHGGLGIGLTLVKRLTELHRGRVEAFSDGPGQGSRFVVTLPLSHASSEAGLSGGTSQHDGSLPRLRILVVDDVEASARTLMMMLRSIGQEVAAVHDGSSAVDYVLHNSPEVVFLDIAMPGMSGYDVARAIRQHPGLADVFLVALTGYGQEDDRRKAIEAGFNHHLTKPTSIEALEQILSTRPEPTRHEAPQVT